MIRDLGQTAQPISKVTAVDNHLDPRRMDEIVPATFIPLDSNKCAGLRRDLVIAPGGRVFLRRNIYISGLVNGAMGIINDITLQILGRDQMLEGQLPPLVQVEFDDVGLHQIKPISIEFEGKRKTKIKGPSFHLFYAGPSQLTNRSG